jgi:hypothetical protein
MTARIEARLAARAEISAEMRGSERENLNVLCTACLWNGVNWIDRRS